MVQHGDVRKPSEGCGIPRAIRYGDQEKETYRCLRVALIRRVM
jgi:hypothetical protein